jgi:hypothetical protein
MQNPVSQAANTAVPKSASRINNNAGLPYPSTAVLVGIRLPAVIFFAVTQTNLESAHGSD